MLAVCLSALSVCLWGLRGQQGWVGWGVSAPCWGVKGGKGCSATHPPSGWCLSVPAHGACPTAAGASLLAHAGQCLSVCLSAS